MVGLDVTAKWELLTRCNDPIPKPKNPDANLRPPTKMNAAPINPKYGFVETSDRLSFTGTMEKMRYFWPDGQDVHRVKREKRKRKRSDSRHSWPMMPMEPRKLGSPSTDFLCHYAFDKSSHLMDWFTAFMPLTPEMNKEDPAAVNVKGDHHTKFAVSNWTSYSNTKATMSGAGEEGNIFAGKHCQFSNQDIVSMIGVYILDGLAPSPQLTHKMQPQSKHPTHGNDQIAVAIGPGFQQKHQSFRHFFACQDPLMSSPAKDKCPNFKVDEFFRWLRHIWKETWLLAEGFFG
jgi:hypothetical protein